MLSTDTDVLLPVLWIQRTEDHAAHGVVPPKEEPAGTRERESPLLGFCSDNAALGRPPGGGSRGVCGGEEAYFMLLLVVWREEQRVRLLEISRPTRLGRVVPGKVGTRKGVRLGVKGSTLPSEMENCQPSGRRGQAE